MDDNTMDESMAKFATVAIFLVVVFFISLVAITKYAAFKKYDGRISVTIDGPSSDVKTLIEHLQSTPTK